MSLFVVAVAYLRRRWGQALLSMLVGALGIAAVGVAQTSIEALPEAAMRSWGGVDLVVGPKGAPLDLVLCCALHVSDPRGLVSEKAALESVHQPMVRAAAPIALGDNIGGWRIAGTTPEILAVYRAKLARGSMWTGPLQAVLGARAAQDLRLNLGATFVGAHGLASGGELHSQFPYRVTGILAPTGSALDRLVLTDIQTVRVIHASHAAEEAAETGVADNTVNLPDAATAVVVSYRSPVAALVVPRHVDADPALTAASPTFEIARLMSYLRPVTDAAVGLGMLLVGIAAAGAAAGLLATMTARARDLALLRVLGARPMKLAFVAVSEACLIAAGALIAGAGLTALALSLEARLIEARTGLILTPHLEFTQVAWLILGTAVVAVLVALVPATRAAHAQMEELLQ